MRSAEKPENCTFNQPKLSIHCLVCPPVQQNIYVSRSGMSSGRQSSRVCLNKRMQVAEKGGEV